MTTEAPKQDWILSYLMMQGELEIEMQFGIEQLGIAMQDMALRASGFSYAELGIGERRAATMAAIIEPMGAVIGSPAMLRNVDETPPGSFAYLKLQGLMRSEDGMSSRGVGSLVNDIQAANSNPNIRGILLEANTGGGESLAGDMLFAALNDSPKAVVVYAHRLASAGIRATVAADEIVGSNPGAQFGSIGTYVSLSKGFREQYKAYVEDIYASKSTRKNEEFRAYIEGDMRPLQRSIDKSNDIFLNEVKKHRPLSGNVEETLSGAMFHAADAKRRGLIDSIGSFNHAVKRLRANAERRKM